MEQWLSASRAVLAGLMWLMWAIQPLALDPAKTPSQYIHQAWTVEQGLPSSTVKAILQTRDGYLWLGTENGLARFDGLRFTVFDRSNTPGLPSNDIQSLVQTRDGSLWIGTNGGGLARMKAGDWETFTTCDGRPLDKIQALLEDSQGGLWIGTLGRGLCRYRNGPLERLEGVSGVTRGQIAFLYEDRQGVLWAVRNGALFCRRNGLFRPFPLNGPLAKFAVTNVLKDRAGTFWIGTEGGLVRYSRGRFSTVAPDLAAARNRIQFIHEDRDGHLWVGIYGGGLLRIRGGRVRVFNMGLGLTDDRPLALLEDTEGTLWIGTRGGGLDQLKDGPISAFSTHEGLPVDLVNTVMEDRDGAVWIGTAGGGLCRLHGGRVRTFTTRQGLSSDSVSALFQNQRGTLWAGTADGRLNRLSGARFQPLTFLDRPRYSKISAILEDSGGRLWVGTRGAGLACIQNGKTTFFTRVGDRSLSTIHALLEGHDGTLWVATAHGLWRFKPGETTPELIDNSLAGESLFGLYEDGEGALWVGSYGGGLFRLWRDRATRITAKDGLYENTVYSILEDNRGRLWFGGNKGISRVEKRALEDFAAERRSTIDSVPFGPAEGMKSRECNGGSQPCAWRGRDGRLWFSTTRGAVVIDPDEVPWAIPSSPIYVEQILLNGHPVDPASRRAFTLGAGALEFRYTCLDYLNPNRLKFRYILEGFDADWVDAGSRRAAYYTNIPPGTYTFRVKATGYNRLESSASFPVTITLKPPFVKSRIFYGLCILAVLLWAIAIYWALVRLYVRRSRMLEAKVTERTAELVSQKNRLAELEERFRTVAESAYDAIVCCKENLSVFFWNDRAQALFGLPSQEALGRPFLALLAPASHEEFNAAIARCQTAGESGTRDLQCVANDGKTFSAEVSISPWHLNEDNFFTLIVRDVTERRSMEQQLRQAQKMEAIGQLAGGVAHDFNNLLQAMLSAIEVLRAERGLSDRAGTIVRELLEDIQRGGRLTRQLLLFSRRETSHPELVDLNRVVGGMAGLFDRLLRENIRCRFDLADSPLWIRADLAQVEQAVINLVVNASDAMSKGGQLTLRSGQEEAGQVWISVSDTGSGIPEHIQERVFEPFFTTKEAEGGSGLGLAVVHGIVTQHGGSIRFESRSGTGTTFRIFFPQAEAAQASPPRAALATEEPERAGEGNRVLLVEDAEGVREWLEEALKMLGYQVISTASAKEALDLPEQEGADLLLSDVLLPDTAGPELADLLKNRWGNLAVVFMSGYAKDHLLDRLSFDEKVRFLQKPFTLDSLARELKEALSRAQAK